jgi:hypothetical protein
LTFLDKEDLANIAKKNEEELRPYHLDANDLKSLEKRIYNEKQKPDNPIFHYTPANDESGEGFCLGEILRQYQKSFLQEFKRRSN